MDIERALELIERFRGRRVAVLGDLYLDEYIVTSAVGLSPEMPVVRVREEARDHALGGAGNVAANFRALGAEVLLGAVVGDDDGAEIAEGLLDRHGIVGAATLRDAGRRTGTLTRVLVRAPSGEAQHQLRLDQESRRAPNPGISAAILQAVDAWISEGGAIVLADYDETPERTGLLSPEVVARVMAMARARRVIVAGLSRRHVAAFRAVDHLFCNRSEAHQLGFAPDVDLEHFAREILPKQTLGALTVTLADRGAFTYGGGVGIFEPSVSTRVVDTCGAGDTLIAATLLARLAGADFVESTHLGVHAAAVAVRKPGTMPVSANELVEQVRFRGAGAGKLVGAQELRRRLDDIRDAQTIVFTNGYFDLFHSGHVELLRQAKAQGDVLVVALNSDRSTRQNKGEGRPVLTERERVDILASLEFVDYVTVFDELTPINVIRALEPDVIVKGGTYQPEDVVGKDLVEAYGGRVTVIPYAGRVTTTKLIQSIKEASDGMREP